MTYPGTQQPGTGTEIRNDETSAPAKESTSGGVDSPEQDERSPGSADATNEEPEGHPT